MRYVAPVLLMIKVAGFILDSGNLPLICQNGLPYKAAGFALVCVGIYSRVSELVKNEASNPSLPCNEDGWIYSFLTIKASGFTVELKGYVHNSGHPYMRQLSKQLNIG